MSVSDNRGPVDRTLQVVPSALPAQESSELSHRLMAVPAQLERLMRPELWRTEAANKDTSKPRLRQVAIGLDRLSAGPQSLGSGYGLMFDPLLSTPGVQVVMRLGGSTGIIAPGFLHNVPFENAQLEFVTGSPTSGVAYFWIGQQPDVDFRVDYVGVQGASAARIVQQASAAYNSTANIPSVVTDGIDIKGCKGLRAILKANGADTFTAGTGVFWLWDPNEAAWYESEVQTILVTGRNRICTADQVITVGSGRAWFEVRSATTSGGSGSIEVRLRAA